MPEDLLGVEIFAVGTWNGIEFTASDLDDMVDAHKKIGSKIKPFAKLGHDPKQGLLQKDGYPASGWIDNLRRVGDKLVSDFKAVPAKVAELIRNKAYGRFSPEVYFNAVLGGTKYPKVLKAVAILGGDTPACTTLDDFINLYGFSPEEAAKVFESEIQGECFALEPTKQEVENMGEIEDLKAKLDVANGLKADAEKKFTDSQKALDEAKGDKSKAEAAKVEAEKAFAEKELGFKRLQVEAKAESVIAERLKEGRILPAQVPLLRAFAVSDMLGADEKGLRVFAFKEGDKDQKVEFNSASELVFKLMDVLGKQIDFTTSSKSTEVPEPNASGDLGTGDLAAETDKAFAEAQKANPSVSYAQVAKEVAAKKHKGGK